MSPVPEPTPIALFFFISGVGAALEVAFKRMTGRKVSGWAGRLWTWSFMLLTARMAARSWFDAGAAGNQTTPSTGPGRLAEPIAGWIIRWVVDEA